MTPTPGTLRQFAFQARRDADDYRRWAHDAIDPARKRQYERAAEARDDDADWYLHVASRGEITTDYLAIEPLPEAAE